MKKFNKFFLITFFILMPWISQACEFTKIPVGTPVANLIEEYDVLPEPDPDYADDTIYKYTFNARTFCDNNELKEAIVYVFLQNFKLIAMKFETYHNDIKKKDLYQFTSSNVGFITDERVKDEKWFGTTKLESDSRYILYSKSKSFDDRILESLLITKAEYSDLLYGEFVEEG